MIRLSNLTKRFGAFTAVDDLSITIEAGDFYGILGPNGAGKTTTIKMMTGLYTPTSGAIAIDGYDMSRRPDEAKRMIGYIPDQPFLYEKLTGREFLHFSAGLYRMSHEEALRRIRELEELFELSPWLDKRSEDYSQGMCQRVSIASALLHEPKVLIIDEPMVGLDPRSAHVVKGVLREQARLGVAIFMSTHSLPVVEELCDRVGIIKAGKLIFEDRRGALESLKQRHNGTFEALFLELTK